MCCTSSFRAQRLNLQRVEQATKSHDIVDIPRSSPYPLDERPREVSCTPVRQGIPGHELVQHVAGLGSILISPTADEDCHQILLNDRPGALTWFVVLGDPARPLEPLGSRRGIRQVHSDSAQRPRQAHSRSCIEVPLHSLELDKHVLSHAQAVLFPRLPLSDEFASRTKSGIPV